MEDFCEDIILIEWADSLDFDGPLRGCVTVLYIYIYVYIPCSCSYRKIVCLGLF